MSSASKVKVIFGTGFIGTFPELDAAYDVLSKHHVDTLDTANIYGDSEAVLGSTGGSKRFGIDTKAPGFSPGSLQPQKIKDAMAKSLKDLRVDRVDVYYLHSPDTETPLEDSLRAINELYVEGKFKRFGISNYNAEEVQEIHSIAKKNNWVLPTVYQGNYNPVSRHIEGDLFPVLRKLDMTFNAYSPLAGGFLVRSAEQLSGSAATGRMDPNTFSGKLYLGMYGKPSLIAALGKWETAATDAGITKAALAYRWVAYHSALKGEYGDGMIIGASNVRQLTQTLEAYEAGPLPEKAVIQVAEIWEMVKDEAPLNNYSDFAGTGIKS